MRCSNFTIAYKYYLESESISLTKLTVKPTDIDIDIYIYIYITNSILILSGSLHAYIQCLKHYMAKSTKCTN